MAPDPIRPLDDLRSALIGREAGALLRERIVRAARHGVVVVDLEGITTIAPSFADELFAKLPAELVKNRRVRFTNASEEIRAQAQGVRGLRSATRPEGGANRDGARCPRGCARRRASERVAVTSPPVPV